MVNHYNVVVATNESTVVTEYESLPRRSEVYQSEADLEDKFIKMLSEQGYEYIQISSEEDLVNNLRKQLEKLNNYQFSDKEWKLFYSTCIANSTEGIVEKTRKIQEDYVQVLKRDDGSSKNIYLIDKRNVHNNFLQVINQYEEKQGAHDTRYDVTILVNGLPLVHIELKRRGVMLKEAFNQINRYQKDSFWAGSGLYEYVQIFVISNGTRTKYYSNTTRSNAVNEKAKVKTKKTSNSFEFTSYWADGNNKIITDLVDFTRTFFAKHTLLNVLTRYCVFTADKMLLVMRPYQIVATERILNRILISSNYNKMGTIDAGGWIWASTGTGKTLTSFKTAQLATNITSIEKVIFVVDRKDLDSQTMKEYDRFEKGAANSNSNTTILQKQLEDDNCRIIVTTIQKLSEFIKRNKTHSVYSKHIVMIFDECHRSQFGEMHTQITTKFKKYHIFGFTGTPIFAQNAIGRTASQLRTTEQVFGDRLHTYTIVDAINDGNVLPFRVDYINTIKKKNLITDEKVQAIDTEEILGSHERIAGIVSYIIEHFDQKTKRNSCYDLKGQRVNGFNSILAVSSIPMAKKYYLEFKKQLAEKNKPLNVAIIYSFSQNENSFESGVLDDESFDVESLDKSSRDFLDDAIDDYNKMFKTSCSTSANGFQNYYESVATKMKDREIDLLIVVNMFLTGFDATTLNTLWVDKNLHQHGLIQAFSRTNRILNSVKTYGNIVCFRDLQEETDDAIALFGNKKAGGIVLLKSFDDYFYGYEEDGKYHTGYQECIDDLKTEFPLGFPIMGEDNIKKFIRLFGGILKLRNILTSFDDFEDNDVLNPRDLQDYTGIYNDLYNDSKRSIEKDSIKDDIVFEIELAKQIEVNIDYILMLVEQYRLKGCGDKEVLVSINRAVKSSLELHSKKDLIDSFVDSVNAKTDVMCEWKKFVKQELEKDTNNLITEEKLKPEETKKLLVDSFRDGYVKTNGETISKIMPVISRFSSNNREEKKQTIIEKLLSLFEKYTGLV